VCSILVFPFFYDQKFNGIILQQEGFVRQKDMFINLKDNDILRVAQPPSEYVTEGNSVVLTLPFKAYRGRSEFKIDEDLETANEKFRITAYGSEIMRITRLSSESFPESQMLTYGNFPPEVKLNIQSHGDFLRITDAFGCRRAELNTAPLKPEGNSNLLPPQTKQLELTFFPDGHTEVPLKSYDMFAHGKMDSIPLGFIEDSNGEITNSLFAFSAESNETFHGTGERFAKLDLAGRTINLLNRDALGVNSRRTYKNVPFYLSSRPYALFLHTSCEADISFADFSTRSVQGNVKSQNLDLFIIGGGSIKQNLFNYALLTGFAPTLPLWSYGVWMSRMTYLSAEEIENIGERLREKDFPCDVLHIDTGWFEKDWICDWKFSSTRFPEPEKFIEKMRKKGFRITLWQTPNIQKKSTVAEFAVKNKMVALADDNVDSDSEFQETARIGSIDFSNPEAVRWYKNNLLKPLLQMGVAAIKTDFGETIDMEADYSSMDAGELRNLYALLYQRAAFEATEEVYGKDMALVWARAGWAGCQRYPLHWGGDAESSWEGMAASLRGGIHLGLSGFPFWSHDVPGFHGTPDFMNTYPNSELYVRWTQFGVFSSHIRFHGTSRREPYYFPEIADIIRFWLKLRYRIIPYILQEAEDARTNALPVIRAMLLEFEKDPVCRFIDDQYMFGRSILAAPVMNGKGVRNIYLPEGEWVDLWTGEKLIGPQWLYNVKIPLEKMPLYAKKGSEIRIYPENVSCTDEMDLKKTLSLTLDDNYSGEIMDFSSG
jgi:alpha-D-xyloside xylohydrolase